MTRSNPGFAFLLAAFAAAALVGACGRSAPPPQAASGLASPVNAIEALVALARRNDVAGLLAAALPPAEHAHFVAGWEARRSGSQPTDEQKSRYHDWVTQLVAPGSEGALFSAAAPRLAAFNERYRQQSPMYVAMGAAWLKALLGDQKGLDANDRAAADQVIDAVAKWAGGLNFADPARLKVAIGIAAKTARKVDLPTLDAVRALPFDAAMQKLAITGSGLKDVLAVYGLSLDAVLDSVTPEVVANDGQAATVRIGYSILGVHGTTMTRWRNVEGRWYPARFVDAPDAPAAAATVDKPAADARTAAAVR
ncbi:MAG: hypothetical protein U1F23_05895 [Lysobacterales bacterium]